MTTKAANKILEQFASQLMGLRTKTPSTPWTAYQMCDAAEDFASIIEEIGEFAATAQVLLFSECIDSTGMGDFTDAKGHEEAIGEHSTELVYELRQAAERNRAELPEAAE